MSNLGQSRNHLQNEWSRLQSHWQTTESLWNDVVRHRFEREFWVLYEPEVQKVLRAMERLDRIVEQAKREVK